VDSAEQLQQVVDGAPNLVLVGQWLSRTSKRALPERACSVLFAAGGASARTTEASCMIPTVVEQIATRRGAAAAK
jgi:hypothetical protein